jgi:membrane-associated phospholipid phosphatase
MREVAMRRANRRGTFALGSAAACAAGLLVVWLLGVRTAVGRERDDVVLHGFVGLARARVYSQLTDVALLVDPVPYALLGLLCIAVALARRRNARALAVAVALVGTGATTQALKHLLAQSRYVDWLGFKQIEGLTWPSGHGTAAMTIALCAVVVAPPAWRGAIALLGCAFAVGIAYATLALVWHYPTDLLGGFLVAGLWIHLALAVVARAEADDPDPERLPPLDWPIALGVVGALVAAALVGLASQPVTLDGTDRATVVIGALALAGLALALAIATIVAASERPVPGGSGASRRGVARRRVPSRA